MMYYTTSPENSDAARLLLSLCTTRLFMNASPEAALVAK